MHCSLLNNISIKNSVKLRVPLRTYDSYCSVARRIARALGRADGQDDKFNNDEPDGLPAGTI